MKSIIIRAESDAELIEVMDFKVRSARMLQVALAEKESLMQALSSCEERIAQFTNDAAVEFEGTAPGPTPPSGNR